MSNPNTDTDERVRQIRERLTRSDRGGAYGTSLDLLCDVRHLFSCLDYERWLPIETAPRDEILLLFAPKEELYNADTIETHPDLALDEMKVAKPRDWTWATHWQRVQPPNRGNGHE